MKINKQTQLWEDLVPTEIVSMRSWVEDALFRGKIAYPTPAWLEMWYQELGYNDNQQLCLQSNGVPQRILMSIVNAQDAEIATLSRGLIL